MSESGLKKPLSYGQFLRGVLRDPKGFSTIFPTGEEVTSTLSELGRVPQSNSILELGVGSGAITTRLIHEKRPEARFVGLEKNIELANKLNKKWNGVEIKCGDASNLSASVGDESFDTIIASLPWTQFTDQELRTIFNESTKHLNSGGVLVFFICLHVLYLPPGQNVMRLFEETSLDIINKKFVFSNLPPVCIFQAG